MATDEPIILISNDDGYQAPGLLALIEAVKDMGDVYVVAPEKPRSGVSRMITLHKPLRVKRFSSPATAYFCSGTPTDCVYIALNHLLPARPDLVLSGINFGANLGDDVTYSGTAAATFEALSHGIPAIAASMVVHGDPEWTSTAELVRDLADEVLEKGLPPRTMLNVNTPHGYVREAGVEVTRLGRRGYERIVNEREDPRGSPYYWIGGPELELDDDPGTDCRAIHESRASVTPVRLDLNAPELREELTGWNFTIENES